MDKLLKKKVSFWFGSKEYGSIFAAAKEERVYPRVGA
jgi:hypothetical protein